MRYAITFTGSDNWESVDTIIVDDKKEVWAGLVVKQDWKKQDELLIKVLKYYGWEKDAERIVHHNRYFIRNCDDIDVSLTDNIVDKDGEEVPFMELN